MTKEQKVKSLNAIREGRLLPSDLEPAKFFGFWEVTGSEPKMYDSEFGIIDVQKMESIIQDIESKNERRANCGLPVDQIIIVNYIKSEGNIDLEIE